MFSLTAVVSAGPASVSGLNRRNKQLLDREIERGSGKALDPFKLADELFQRAESRKVNLLFITTCEGMC